ncbi:hypothetical protein [Aliarcobacter butzleri]|uniref:hypothetical protein n=1 Tax=Aliarcobacter butzleri TaxID=28197 RepID=UPI00186A1D51|nr:hypothetical protein [Aliarcobacter butzleri]
MLDIMVIASKGNYLVLEYKENKLIKEEFLSNVKWYDDKFGGYYKGQFIQISTSNAF